MEVQKLQVRNEKQLKEALDSLYSNSLEGKDFYGLIELIKNENTIITAIHNIKSNSGSKTLGVDRKSMNYYLQMNREQCIGLGKERKMNQKLDLHSTNLMNFTL